jgi:hypothetical protein
LITCSPVFIRTAIVLFVTPAQTRTRILRSRFVNPRSTNRPFAVIMLGEYQTAQAAVPSLLVSGVIPRARSVS